MNRTAMFLERGAHDEEAVMSKAELVKHLNVDHGQAERNVIIEKRWTKADLSDLHRLIHLARGR